MTSNDSLTDRRASGSVGAVWLVHLLGYNLSVAVWVGMIAMAGLGAEMGLLMLLYLDLAWRRGLAEGVVADRSVRVLIGLPVRKKVEAPLLRDDRVARVVGS